MNTTNEVRCTCNTCPGASCTCGCQKAVANTACACGPECKCGPGCKCAAK